ncbi:uncharacterized protein LOC131876977 [Tigriopus californicus]|uniref:uncharacterized protein LOC131876977 n=1 Tax=Tigriopus californicus TaxID=6832 RepID=UPI0027D9DD0A|nr:uncharacterized protein LOC131876977 [Tigriopus californicus]
MNCSVCKGVKVESVVGNEEKNRWHSTCQRTPVLGVKVLYKLYDLTKTEFESGFLCGLCFDLVIQIEQLEAQLKSQVGQGCEKYRKSALQPLTDDNLWMEDGPSSPANHLNDDESPSSPADHLGDDGPSSPANHIDHDDDDNKNFLVEEDDINDDSQLLVNGHEYHRTNDEPTHSPVGGDDQPGSPQSWKECPAPKHDFTPLKNTTSETNDEDNDMTQSDTEPINLNIKPRIRGKKRIPIPHNLGKYNIQKDNLDFNVTVGLTRMNTDALIYKGNKYFMVDIYKDKLGKIPELMAQWKCRHINCRGRLVTYLNHQCVLLDTVVEHSHPPMTKHRMLIEEFQDQVKRLVMEHQDMTPPGIFAAAYAMCPNTPFVNKKPLMGYIRRQLKQKKNRP